MKRIIYEIILLMFGAAVIVSCTPAKEGPPPIIGMKDFFRNPLKSSYKLCPDGSHLAFLQPWESRMNIHVQKIGDKKITRITESTARDIAAYMWGTNNRIVFAQDKGGNENWHIFAVNIDGSNSKELTPFAGVRAGLIDDLENDEEHMLISMNKRDRKIFDVYRINIDSGDMKMIAKNPGNITGWQTDWDGRLRIAHSSDGVNQSILYRKTDADKFETVITTNFKESLIPLFFAFDDNETIYALSNLGRDKTAVVKYNLAENNELEVIYQHPEVDASNLLVSKKRKVITGVTYTTDRRRCHFFDDQRKNLQKILRKKLPGVEAVVVSMNRAEDKVLVRTYSDKTMGAYYFYDFNTKELKQLVEISPWLNAENMAEMKPVRYESRDGLTINGYLTLPKGVEAKNLPAVINPHGGPWYRDSWGFNPEVQFLANRGYAVLQMNFRGSSGYGRRFRELGYKQWGKTMQDDITDGADWLIREGIADSARIGIYGGSYGGYAVLAGLTKTPDLYACGIDYVGISNLFTFLKSVPPYWEPMRQMFYEMIGNPEKDREFLTEISPVFHADKITAPLFIAQGANDIRVNKSESDQMVEALKNRGIFVEYMVKENEGHGFNNEENRFEFYNTVEKFLGVHLGGRISPPETPAVN